MEWTGNEGLVSEQQRSGGRVSGKVLELVALNEEVGKAVEIRLPTVTPCYLLAASIVTLTT